MNNSELITVIIPAYNEEGRIGKVVSSVVDASYKVLVVDDGSQDNTVKEASLAGVEVIEKEKNTGYLDSIKVGFLHAEGDIIVTMDADGEHNPEYISQLVQPIFDGKAELVLGVRTKIHRFSERIINWLTNIRVKTQDCGTGMRAIKKELAVEMKLPGYCTCGTFVLEAKSLGARITDVPIVLRNTDKPRGIAWRHFKQIFCVLKMLI